MRCAEFSFPRDLVKQWDRKLYAVDGDLLNNNIADKYSVASPTPSGVSLAPIDCLINQEYTINCKHDDQGHEIYVPFSFLRQYFDISGSMSHPASPQSPSQALDDNNNQINTIDNDSASAVKFIWMHSTAKINYPKGKYDPKGLFMYFENYNVEVSLCASLKTINK